MTIINTGANVFALNAGKVSDWSQNGKSLSFLVIKTPTDYKKNINEEINYDKYNIDSYLNAL